MVKKTWVIKMIDKIKHFLNIHWKVVVVSILSYFIVDEPAIILESLLIIGAFELFALEVYEYIIRFTANNKFLIDLFNGDDTKFSIMETVGFSTFQAAALLSAHLLVGICVYTVYMAAIAPPLP